jgi:hypothetical protein
MAHLAANDVLEVREAMTKVTDVHTDRLLPYRKRRLDRTFMTGR